MNRYEKFINRYSKLGKRVADLSRIKRLMSMVGDPQERLRFVHIAGTNGKGSTAEMLASALTSAGYRTGLFTSPYILRYNDRMRIDGKDITDAELDSLSGTVSQAVGDETGYSQFEITQAMAMLWFEEQQCDIVVLEAGLGGLLDSTNVIPPPLVSVICSVALDHTAILGDTAAQIAEQKAGIIKRGAAAVLAPENPDEAAEVIRSRAESCGSRLVIPDMSRLSVESCTAFGSRFSYKGYRYHVAMGGYHQIKNALTVIEAAALLKERGFELEKQHLDAGLSACIPARVQLLSRSPMVILDGGHNPDGVGALCGALETLDCKKRIVVGMLGDKDSESSLRLLASAADSFICVDGFFPSARSKTELAELLRSYGAAAEVSDRGAAETVQHEIEIQEHGTALVICGSLYLASVVLDAMKG